MNGFDFRGRDSVIFMSASLFHFVQLLKERVSSDKSNFFLIGGDPIVDGVCHQGEQTGGFRLNPFHANYILNVYNMSYMHLSKYCLNQTGSY